MTEKEKKTPFLRGHGFIDITLYGPDTKKTRV